LVPLQIAMLRGHRLKRRAELSPPLVLWGGGQAAHPISTHFGNALSGRAYSMDTTTLLIIVVVVLLLGGGGFYWGRRR